MNRWKILAAGTAVVLLGIDPALARHRHPHHHATRHQYFQPRRSAASAGFSGCSLGNDGRQLCVQPAQQRRVTRRQRVHRQRNSVATVGARAAAFIDGCTSDNNGRKICLQPAQPVYGDAVDTAAVRPRRARSVAGYDGTIIGGRPSGCPNAYCGCGLRKYLGLADKRLNLAWNWARLFPRVAGPAPGVAAVRGHHVMYIEGAAGDGLWTVRDYNSGHGLSRIHVRDVRGYIFVQPHGQVVADGRV